jgi:hypothetical protein
VSGRRIDAVVKTFYVDPKYAIEIDLGCVLRIPDVRDASVIYQNVNAIMLENLGEPGDDFGLISNVAGMGRSSCSSGGDFGRNGFGILCADIKNVNCSSICCELLRDGPANSAASTGDDCSFPIKPEFTRASVLGCQRETPRFQGMKSS